MTKDRDLEIAQLWIGHLCHELVNPIGALNNGIELIEEGEAPELQKDALDLIAHSGRIAAARLRFFRLAYGRSGSAQDFTFDNARDAAMEVLAVDGRVRLDWPDEPFPACTAGGAQLLMNLAILGAGGLPRGGSVAVTSSTGQSHLAVTIEVSGSPAHLGPDIIHAATGLSRDMDHHTAHALMCARLAAKLGERLTILETDATVRILAALPLDHEP